MSRKRSNLKSKKLESVIQSHKIIKKARRRDRDNIKHDLLEEIAEDEEIRQLLDENIPKDDDTEAEPTQSDTGCESSSSSPLHGQEEAV